MTRTEIVNEIFKQLEDNHIYLYHDISKEEFEKHKQKFLKSVDGLDDVHFHGGMLRLFALFKDAHLFYDGAKFNFVNAFITKIGKKFYLKDGEKFLQIKKINGHDIDAVVNKLKKLVAYETETWAYYEIGSRLIYSPQAMQMIDCATGDKQITYTCEDGKDYAKSLPTKEEIEKYSGKPKPFYESKIFDDNVLYIRYRRCANMKDYPFEKFMKDVRKSLKQKPKACLVDVRDNMGGSDTVMKPLVKWLKDNKIKTYALMNEGTFSAGTFALADLKEIGATLIGQKAGQPTRVYGNTECLQVEGLRFSYCTKYFELTSVHDENAPVKPNYATDAFDYAGVIKPDIKVENKIKDLRQGVDTQLERAKKIIQKEIACEQAEENQ